MLRAIEDTAELAALTTDVVISDNWDKWFISICMSNMSAILIELLLAFNCASFVFALTVAALIIYNNPPILKALWWTLIRLMLLVIIGLLLYSQVSRAFRLWKLHFLKSVENYSLDNSISETLRIYKN